MSRYTRKVHDRCKLSTQTDTEWCKCTASFSPSPLPACSASLQQKGSLRHCFVADLDAPGSRSPHPTLWVPCQAESCDGQIPAWEERFESFHAACMRTSRNTLHQCLMKCHSVKEGSASLLAICWCYVCQTARVKAKWLVRGKPWRRTKLLKEGL